MSRRIKRFGAGLLVGGLAVSAVVVVANFREHGADARASVRPAVARLVTDGFSALHDATLAPAPASVVAELRAIHPGAYTSAKTLHPGTYLAANGGMLCAYVEGGMAGCTDRLDPPDAWLAGDMRREFDSQLAPFEVHLYGFARDSVTAFRVTTSSGVHTAEVVDNAFDVTLHDTTFDEVVAIDEVYAFGRVSKLDPRRYFPTRRELGRFAHY